MPESTIHEWSAEVFEVDENNNIIQVLAQCAMYRMAHAAYKAAVKHRTNAIIQLRKRGRIVWTAKTGSYDYETETVALEWEK